MNIASVKVKTVRKTQIAITTKYALGDECWFLDVNKIRNARIVKIKTEVQVAEGLPEASDISVVYTVEYNAADGLKSTAVKYTNELFLSRQDLLNSL